MIESERFTLERFIHVNTEFYKKYQLFVLSVTLKMIQASRSDYSWRLQFDYEMLRSRDVKKSAGNKGNETDREEALSKWVTGFSNKDSRGVFAFSHNQGLPEMQRSLALVKQQFSLGTGYDIPVNDEITDMILETEAIEKIMQENLQNRGDFPYDDWCANFIGTYVKDPSMDAHYVDLKEKLMEEFIRDHPAEFIRQPMTLLSQQELLLKFRPDLVFKNEKGEIVIVELQLGSLDKTHLYKSIEYRDLYKKKHGVDNVRVLLISNELPEKYKDLVAQHDLEHLVITREHFLAKVRELHPEMRIREADVSPNDARPFDKLTIREILKIVHRGGGNSLPLEATVFCYFPFRDPANTSLVDFSSYKKDLGRNYRHLEWLRGGQKGVPVEIIMQQATFDALHGQMLDILQAWAINLTIRTRDHRHDPFFDHEFILGHWESPDHYQYERYMKNLLPYSGILCRRYEGDWSVYNKEKISEELTILQSFTLYANKYPDYTPVPLFESFEVTEGPGPLDKMGTWGTHQWDKPGSWLTVKWKGVNAAVLDTANELLTLWGRDTHEIAGDGKLDFKGFLSVIPFRNIPEEGLILTSAYFDHIKKVKGYERVHTRKSRFEDY